MSTPACVCRSPARVHSFRTAAASQTPTSSCLSPPSRRPGDIHQPFSICSLDHNICCVSTPRRCPNQGQSGVLAYASPCQRDQTDRPVIGTINFCPFSVPSTVNDPNYNVLFYTTIHEMFHALGANTQPFCCGHRMFSRPLIVFFRFIYVCAGNCRCVDCLSRK